MSEFWKSTPKYWCKFCKTFVKDTKFEKQQHEATGKHQGNVQRHLRELQKQQDREDREKQRAQAEEARANGVAPSKKLDSASSSKPMPGASRPAPQVNRPATIDERKRQMQQLADMGVAIPQEFRKDMAMAGDWQTIEEKVIGEDVKPDVKSIGISKRKRGDEDEDNEEDGIAEPLQGKAWGSKFKSFSRHEEADDIDIEALLGGNSNNTTARGNAADAASKRSGPDSKGDEAGSSLPPLKKEASEHAENTTLAGLGDPSVLVKQEDESAASTVAAPVFKKRKAKALRQ